MKAIDELGDREEGCGTGVHRGEPMLRRVTVERGSEEGEEEAVQDLYGGGWVEIGQ